MSSASIFKRPASDNKVYLSIDYYENGRRVRKALKMFLYENPKTPTEKNHNKEVNIMLDTIKSEQTLALQRGEHGITDYRKKFKDFTDYFNSLVLKREETGVNLSAWKVTKKHLNNFVPNGIGFNQISTNWLDDFRNYLHFTLKLSSATVMQYFDILQQ